MSIKYNPLTATLLGLSMSNVLLLLRNDTFPHLPSFQTPNRNMPTFCFTLFNEFVNEECTNCTNGLEME